MKIRHSVTLINYFFFQHHYLLFLILFLISFLLFFYLQLLPTFPDPDSFYHTKITLLIKEQGMVQQFPWLQFTILRYYYVDHHFLYHLALIPFVFISDPLLGVKLATIIFASLTIVVFYWLLERLKVKGAFFYALFLLTINPFIFRINLAKAQAIVLIFLFLGLYFIFYRKYLALFTWAFFYVWLYGGWPVSLGIVFLYWLISSLFVKLIGLKKYLLWQKNKLKFWLKKFFSVQQIRLLIPPILGVGWAILLSPYFPKNLYFYWQQTFKIALVNYQSIIGVGGEWYPYQFLDLLAVACPFFILLLIALTLFFLRPKNQSATSLTFLVLVLIFFFLTLKSRRNVEYLIPMGVAFSGISISNFFKDLNLKIFLKELREFFKENKIIFLGFLVILLMFPYIFYRDLSSVKNSFNSGIPFSKFEAASLWLKKNTLPGQVVFHSDWDEFPMLFYHNSFNYYIVGLDPTFMYQYDKNLYWDWVRITTGQEKEKLYPLIKKVFGADYVFVDFNKNKVMVENLEDNFYFQKVYEDKEAKIYQVTE